MIDTDKVLQLIRQKGPVVPNQLTGELKQNSIIMGAVLSDLAAQKKLKISTVKMGGSPLYYVPEHKDRLQNFFKNLNEKDRDSAELLKQKKVLRDSELTPLLRVSMRNIKDFAVPLEVTADGNRMLFWKYYLITDEEATELIREHFAPKQKPQEPKERKESATEARKPETKKPEKRAEKREEFILASDEPQLSDPFHSRLSRFFKDNNIAIREAKLIKRNSEMDYIIDVPSSVGSIEYYCKAKSKKTCNEGDLATAFVQGQQRKLPVLFLTPGKLTKKAEEMLGKEFKGMKVKTEVGK